MKKIIVRTYRKNVIIDSEFAKKYIELKRLEKELEPFIKTMKTELLDTMETTGRESVISNGIAVSYINSYDKTTIDSDLLKEKYPTVYNEVARVSTIKPTLKIKVNV